MSIDLADSPFTVVVKSDMFGNRRLTMPWQYVVNVKEFGAVGDGVAHDGASIQAAFDYAYGPSGSPHGSQSANVAVFIPAGTYLIEQELSISSNISATGAFVFGAGQLATTLKYIGPDSKSFATFTSLLTLRSVNHSNFEGITFDATGSNAKVCLYLGSYPLLDAHGTSIYWNDCGFVGGSTDGILADGNALGSEQLFIGCRFDSCSGNGGAVQTGAGNALDWTFIQCSFTNCTYGINSLVGAVNLVKGCYFSSNSVTDIFITQVQSPAVIGCYSDSVTFCSAGPVWICGCYHNPSSAGSIYDSTATVNPGIQQAFVVMEDCFIGANSEIKTVNQPTQKAALRGNVSVNQSWLANCLCTTSSE